MKIAQRIIGHSPRNLKMSTFEVVFTAYITDQRIISASSYGVKDMKFLRLEQLLTSISSLRGLGAKRVKFFLEHGKDYEKFQEFTKDFVKEMFPDSDYKTHRLSDFQEWKKVADSLTEDCVLLNANHDHAFLLDNQELFQEYVDLIASKPIGTLASITHWPEYMSMKKLNQSDQAIGGLPVLTHEVKQVIGTILVRRETFQSWFKKDFTEGKKFVRPDNPFGPSIVFENQIELIPPFEFFRHLDGYGHIGIDTTYASSLKPVLRLKKNGGIERTNWAKEDTADRHNFNPTQSRFCQLTDRTDREAQIRTLIKKSWARGWVPRNSRIFLNDVELERKIIIFTQVLLDFRFINSLVVSRTKWHRRKYLYTIRLNLSKLWRSKLRKN